MSGAWLRDQIPPRNWSDTFNRGRRALFDNVVSPSQQRDGHIDAECLGGLEVDHQLGRDSGSRD